MFGLYFSGADAIVTFEDVMASDVERSGLTTLRLISRPGFHDELTAYTTRMLDGLQQRADAAGIPSSPPRRAACSACTSAAPTPSSPSRT